MSEITIAVDQDLMSRAQKALGARSKSETIRRALEEVLRRRLAEALTHQGGVEVDLDPGRLEEWRAQR